MALDKLKPATYSAITYEHGRVFYKKTLGGENVGKLYFREGWNGAEKLLFDPATYKAGVTTTIQSIVPSWDGKYVAMGFSSGGAEWSEIRALDVDRGTLLPESIYPSYRPIGWMKDSKSFFYDAGKVTDIKSLEIELNRKTKVHKLGAGVSTDIDIFSNEINPELGIAAKEFPSAFIDESYPDYLIGFVETVQREMRIFYAPVSEAETQKNQMGCPVQNLGQPGPGDCVPWELRLRRHSFRRAKIQDGSNEGEASRLGTRRNRDSRGD